MVDLQTDLIALDETRIVAPLLRSERYALFPKLTPLVSVDDAIYIARIQQMTALRGKDLGPAIGSAQDNADELLRAIDILTRGF